MNNSIIMRQHGSESPATFAEVKRAANGNWPAILSRIGLDIQLNRHLPCPGCGGRDRFRFDDMNGDGGFICGQGGGEVLAGDGFSLLSHVYGWRPKQALEAVSDVLGISTAQRMQRPTKPRPVPRTKQPDAPAPRGLEDYALQVWNSADTCATGHPYLQRKGFDWAAGARRGVVSGRVVGRNADCLIIPIRNIASLKVLAIQAINSSGKKQTFGKVRGHSFLCGNDLDPTIPWIVVEGWADAMAMVFSVYCGNAFCAAAMGKQNMRAVAENLAAKYRPNEILILEDAA